MILDVTRGSLCVGVEQYPLRVALPDGMFISEVTTEYALSLLPPAEEVMRSQMNLGVWVGYGAAIDRLLYGASLVNVSVSAITTADGAEGAEGADSALKTKTKTKTKAKTKTKTVASAVEESMEHVQGEGEKEKEKKEEKEKEEKEEEERRKEGEKM